MNDLIKTTDVDKHIEYHKSKLATVTGAEREWHFRSFNLLSQGYLAIDEMIDMAIASNVMMDTAICKIKRGTKIAEGVELIGACRLEGTDISIGAGVLLDNATIRGNHVNIGSNSSVSGSIDLDNFVCGSENRLNAVTGRNAGKILLGNNNCLSGVSFDNSGKGNITIGNNNRLNAGLSVNCLFGPDPIYIGHNNDLGRDGGGVISTAYAFSRGWAGPLCIGQNIETTRGAEILGFSVIGWPLDQASAVARECLDISLSELFRKGTATQLNQFQNDLIATAIDESSNFKPKDVSLFGAMKIKRSCLCESVKLKDQAKVTWTYLENVIAAERVVFLHSHVAAPNKDKIRIQIPGTVLDKQWIDKPHDWEGFPKKVTHTDYPQSDEEYFSR